MKQFFYNALEGEAKTLREKMVHIMLSLLIVVNVAAMIISTLPEFAVYAHYFWLFEVFSLFVFFVEYIIRIWCITQGEKYTSRLEYMRSPLMLFDAAVIFPGIIFIFFPGVFDGRILRILRAFRIFRLKEYSSSLSNIVAIIQEHKNDLISAFVLIFMGVITASTLMYYAEKDLQPEKLSSIPDALYWGFITLSTIGYGDITPVSALGKIITVITALLGVAIYALPTSILGAAFYAELRSKEAKKLQYLEQKVSSLLKEIEGLKQKIPEEELHSSPQKKKNKWLKRFLP